jgi:hypothetical protein
VYGIYFCAKNFDGLIELQIFQFRYPLQAFEERSSYNIHAVWEIPAFSAGFVSVTPQFHYGTACHSSETSLFGGRTKGHL